jgi:hypothetical protein
MTTLALRLVTDDHTGLTNSGAILLVVIFAAVFTIVCGLIDYLRRH